MAEKANSMDQLIKQIGEMSILEVSELVKALENEFGVSAAMPVAAAPVAAGGDVAAAEEKSEFKVILESFGSEKIKVIKELRKLVPNLALGDAKKMVEDAPSVVTEAAPKDEAENMKKSLEAVGAKVKLS